MPLCRSSFPPASVLLGGNAVLVIGHRGAGKSTLVAALARHGVRVLGDDAVRLRETPGGWEVLPSYPGIRLWPDSTEWLKVDPRELTPMADESDKLRWAPDKLRWAPHADGSPSPLPLLSHLVFLEGPPASGRAEISLSSPRSALLAILEHSFYLSPMSREDGPRFELMGRVVDRYPIHTLRHEQNYTCLDEVIGTFVSAFGAQ
jgi:energy-coupling factor transporter ATP-binding protein EcfA2